jgi:hypothetical protein
MIQNIVFFNTSCKLQISLQDKFGSTHVKPGPPLHFVQVQICYPRHIRSTLTD